MKSASINKIQPDLSIVFPVHNEKASIEKVLKDWKDAVLKLKINAEIIVCEDGSVDGTTELLKSLQKKLSLTLNQSTDRRGYGGAVVSGIEQSKGRFILCVDSDGQCDPNDLKKFWEKRKANDVLIGWRKTRKDSVQRKLYSLFFKTVFFFLFPARIHDPSAPFVLFEKASYRKIAKYLSFLSEGFWWGFVGACVKKNIPIHEVAIHHRERKQGNTRVYTLEKIPSIALRNLSGLIKLRKSA